MALSGWSFSCRPQRMGSMVDSRDPVDAIGVRQNIVVRQDIVVRCRSLNKTFGVSPRHVR